MKIVSWNVNGYRSITGQNPSKRYDKVTKENKFFEYIVREQPDIIAIQETKANLEQINEELRTPEDYFAYYNSAKIKKGYSGVAIFTKKEPEEVRYGFGQSRFDDEGRIIEIVFDDFTLLNIYFPKGYADHERLDYKLEFYNYLFDYLNKNKDRNFIISGDYNTARKEIDLARPKQNTGTSGFMPIECAKLDKLIEMGFIDTFRMFIKDGGHYTWWSQRGRARENNVGWRIDYHFISESMKNKVINSFHQPEQTGSDHCPIVLELK
jgi:exodeoxyribonuclease-3